MITIGLCVILLAVLALPFLFKTIEHNLEVFLFVMGITAAFISKQISWHLSFEALREPIPITLAVLVFGLVFKWTKKLLDQFIKIAIKKISIQVFVFFLIIILGSIASVITAIIASLILVEVISMLCLDKKHEAKLVIIACFAIGVGAVLTPIGEPLSTIAIAKLRSWHGVNFWYLARLLGIEIFVLILGLGVLSIFFHGKFVKSSLGVEHRDEKYSQIIFRAAKVYLFVMALVFLGQGFKPVIDMYITKLSGDVLYWINTISAVLDNATLTAAEVSSAMTPIQVKKILMGLLISGGMLIPGNIPNIIAASKLKIGSKEWAKLGVPLGFVIMIVFFFILEME